MRLPVPVLEGLVEAAAGVVLAVGPSTGTARAPLTVAATPATAAPATAAANAPDGTVVTPVVPGGYGYEYGYGYGYGPGWGHGFSIFGFLGTLLFIFLIFGLLRAIFFRGGPGRRGGWGPGWGGGPGGWNTGNHDHDRTRNFWESRFGESFDEWHRKAHETGSSTEPPASNTPSKPA